MIGNGKPARWEDERGGRTIESVLVPVLDGAGAVRQLATYARDVTDQRRAEYYDLEQRMVLIGDARVWQDDNVVTGETITIFLSQDRSVVQGGKQDRVKAVFYPREQKDGAAAPKKDAAGKAPCAN